MKIYIICTLSLMLLGCGKNESTVVGQGSTEEDVSIFVDEDDEFVVSDSPIQISGANLSLVDSVSNKIQINTLTDQEESKERHVSEFEFESNPFDIKILNRNSYNIGYRNLKILFPATYKPSSGRAAVIDGASHFANLIAIEILSSEDSKELHTDGLLDWSAVLNLGGVLSSSYLNSQSNVSLTTIEKVSFHLIAENKKIVENLKDKGVELHTIQDSFSDALNESFERTLIAQKIKDKTYDTRTQSKFSETLFLKKIKEKSSDSVNVRIDENEFGVTNKTIEELKNNGEETKITEIYEILQQQDDERLTISTAHSLLSVSSESVVSGGSVTLTLQAKNESGAKIGFGGATVIFNHPNATESSASSDDSVSTGEISATTDHNDGTYTATFTGVKSGSPIMIGATINGVLVTSSSPSITVNAGSYSLSRSLVTVSSETVNVNSKIYVTLDLKDTNGNKVSLGGQNVNFFSEGGTSQVLIGQPIDEENGRYIATLIGQLAGGPTSIKTTINGSNVSSESPAVTVNAEGGFDLSLSTISVSSKTVSTGMSIDVILVIRDSNNHEIAVGGRNVVFSHSGGSSTGFFSGVTDNSDGTYSSTFTGTVSGSATSIICTIDGDSVASLSPMVTVEP